MMLRSALKTLVAPKVAGVSTMCRVKGPRAQRPHEKIMSAIVAIRTILDKAVQTNDESGAEARLGLFWVKNQTWK